MNGLAPECLSTNARNESKPRRSSVHEEITIPTRRFLITPKPGPPRRDVHLQHVIINEKADQKLSEHRVSLISLRSLSIIRLRSLQVSELPFPFVNADQFESLMQQPLGREWNPETAYRRLNQPKVRTRLGVRIEPLNKQDVFLKKNAAKADQSTLNFELVGAEKAEAPASNIEQDSLFDNDQSHKKKLKRKRMQT